jgi:hypothetical protein
LTRGRRSQQYPHGTEASELPVRSPSSRENTLILGFFLAALCWSIGVSAWGWSHAISDWYGWRQTQTAISAYFMLQGGPWLDYEMPIFGPPWQIPHEFPLYQALVVMLTTVSGLRLEAAGRAVSLAFWYAALPAGHLLLAHFGIAPRRRLLPLAFWLLSPLYLFWSRTFMIESTALCLCLTFLVFHGRFVTRGHAGDALAALAAGCLGAAVKPPTIVVFAGLAGVWWLVAQRRSESTPNMRILGALLVVLPPLAGWAWQRHADTVKALNPFTAVISSSQLLRDYVVGPPGSRFDAEALLPLWERAVPYTVGHPVVVAAALVGIVIAQRRRMLFALALGGFLAHFAIFAPLDSTQDYYWYGMGLFLVAATGLAVVALLECDDPRRHLAWPLVVLVTVCCVQGYATRMLPFQRHDAYANPDWVIRLARAVTEATHPEDVVVAFGLDWNPELPYYAGRRALMWPGWSDARPDSADVARAHANLNGHPVGAVVNCPRGAPDATVARFRERFALVPSPTLEHRCKLYVRPVPPAAPPSSPISPPAVVLHPR